MTIRWVNSLTTQLHVPPRPARPLAESLVNGHFECPLGGKYVLVDPLRAPVSRDAQCTRPRGSPSCSRRRGRFSDRAGSRLLWTSTATPLANRFLLTEIPADYQMPLMNWFRGLTADAGRAGDELSLHAALDMTHIDVGPPEDPSGKSNGISLPGISDLFSGFGAKKDENVKPASGTEPAPPAKK